MSLSTQTAPAGVIGRFERFRDLLSEIRANVVEARAMQALAPLLDGYVAWTHWSMRPSGLVTVLNDIVVNRRRNVVECGGGTSTVLIARLLADVGGRLVTIEHDDSFASSLEEQLAGAGLTEHVSVLTAPLKSCELSMDGTPWYDENVLASIELPPDLLLVDGPPAWSEELSHSRYPALPYFWDALREDFTVILDDIHRPGERDVVDAWERELGLSFERRPHSGSIAIARSAASFDV